MTEVRARDDLDVAQVQRRTLGVLSVYQALSGIAVAGAIPAGALIAAGVAGSEAAAGFAGDFLAGRALLRFDGLLLHRLGLLHQCVEVHRCRSWSEWAVPAQ